MFSSTFYPTPVGLAARLVAPMGFQDAYVLEPSAGKGDLLDVIAQKASHSYERGSTRLYAIESVPDLCAVLEGKGYPVLARDFLTYQPRVHFSHIVMNPPFDRAIEHLQHAWSILYEGEIAAIMPATALEGKTAPERALLKLIEDHGRREAVRGEPFLDAERKTRVAVEIVRLTKRAAGDGERLEFGLHNESTGEWASAHGNGQTREVGLNGFLADLLAHYQAGLGNFETYNLARQKLQTYVAPFAGAKSALEISDDQKTPTDRWNTFYSTLTEQAWGKLLDHPGFQTILTERARAMMTEFRQRQRRVDFNEANVRAMLDALVAKRDDLLNAAVQDAFNTMTEYHKDNRVYFEGWKSVQAWKVNWRKVVLPWMTSLRWGGGIQIMYDRQVKLDDIDRALSIVSGQAFTEITTICKAIETAVANNPRDKRAWSTFFEVRYFLKGTIHLRFHDEDLADKFNLMAAKGRAWLPPGDV